jgi:hypothetical protein
MDVFGTYIPVKVLTNFDLSEYATQLNIPYFRGVFMRDTLPKSPHKVECGIVNLNTSAQKGSHWVSYYKNGTRRIYFDSFGQITPLEIQNYLKKRRERGVGVILRNTDIVQPINTNICGHLCLFVLKALTSEHWTFQQVLNTLNNGYS